jgi:uncharacterized protein (DUF697 family)
MISRFSAHLIIHGFALSHGATAFFLDHVPVPGSATAALTAETVAMVAIIVKVCGASWTQATIEAFAAQQLARFVGVTVAREGAKYVPIFGPSFSACATTVITEAVGWATYEACRAQLTGK